MTLPSLGAAADAAGDALQHAGESVGLVEGTVIPGDPASVAELSSQLRSLGDAFERVAGGYRRLDTSSWTGKAADAARDQLDLAPRQWTRAADAFGEAGTAVAEYQRVLAECQPRAERAKQQLDQAMDSSKAARQQHNDAVDAAEAGTGPPPTPFSDPYAGQIAEARRTIAQCQQAVAEAGARAAAAVRRAAESAPDEPGLLTKLRQGGMDAMQQAGRAAGNMAAGVFDGVKGIASVARVASPFDPQMLLDPVGKVEAMGTMTASVGGTVVGLVTNPGQTVSTLVDAETWQNNPAKAAGKLIPDLALGAVTGGGGAAASRGASTASRAAQAGRTAAEKAGEKASKIGEKLHRPGRVSEGDFRSTTPESSPEASESPGSAAAEPQSPPRAPEPEGPLDANGDPFHTPQQNDPFVRSGDVHGPPSPDATLGPAEPVPGGRPEGHDLPPPRHDDLSGQQPGPDASSDHGPDQRPDLPGHEPGSAFEDAERYVAEHGDPISFGQHSWEDFNPGDDLPKGLTDKPVDSYGGNASEELLYRNMDPNEAPLYRKMDGSLHDIFSNGVSSRHPDAPADLGTLGAHMGNTGNPTPFISTSDSLGHVLSRDGGFHDGVVLDIRDPGGHAVDADATFKQVDGDRFMSHGEGEKAYLRQIPPEHIKGGWENVNGHPRWFDNPHFDHRILERSSTS